MTTQGQRAGDPWGVGTTVYPQLVGALVLCGWAPEAARAFVEKQIARAVHGGLVGGTAAAALLVEEVFETAPPPPAPRPPADAVEAALAALPWEERLATVAVTVFGTPRIRDGRPVDVASALGATTDPWAPTEDDRPDLSRVLAEAVDARAAPAEPDLLDRLVAQTQRRNRWISTAVTVAVVVVLLVAAVAAAALAGSRSPSGTTDAPPVTTGSPYAITQWVAVLESGPSPASLAARARALGEVVGVHVFTDRWACYEGLGPGPADAPWFLGIGAVDRAVLNELVARSGAPVQQTAQVRQVCVQPPPTPDVPVLSVPAGER